MRVLLVALAVLATATRAQDVEVRDAGTLGVSSSKPFRLNGVDAPELNTFARKDARLFKVNFLAGDEQNGERTHQGHQ